ncbi:CsbD family protein [Nocardia uniformis]|uniref:CsbD family protein n=1 Tax=Nocardia uniformis TaxID=53432 RepID=A0A849BVM0_9NOCA|nr:CsbD family protein [Nocardia uniformis]NNH70643.1 CsbD family protein [Nocardia uniformis]
MRGVRGSINKVLGRATGDRPLAAQGRRDQSRSDLGRAAQRLRAAFRR